ncbi:Xylose operon regulatory protein [Rubripirellula tenax]|uniref:Xylose operon regulatory protein n=1 Tax=Rubripirellula tenax TaxID=2528015 RepID=A0A5C6FHS4_9BACT|nr:DNA-binding transcriptional regulator [Rubripirellula tenax]TWU59171.1 Xylose operon regulatory protein [Rubripirellula tenax]
MSNSAAKKTKSPIEPKQILLLVESSRAYGRGCLMGIASYIRAHGPWQVLHLERGLEERVPAFLHAQRFDGVIARIENETLAKSVAKLKIPTVDLRGVVVPANGVMFDTDPEACSELAFEHFRQRGFQRLAYCGYNGVLFSDQRRDAFLRLCEAQNLTPLVYDATVENEIFKSKIKGGIVQREAQAELPEPALVEWLRALVGPVGIFACNDVRGRQVLQAATLAGRRAPDEVAVLGVDDDEVICELANPPLSSIEPDTQRMGFEGAMALDRLMAGEPIQDRQILIPPRRISVRRSSDLLAIDDQEVAAAVHFIREHACEGISVKQVADAVAISRVTLERRFRAILNRSPREEIERVRIDQIRLMLTQTRYSLMQIATMTGYRSDAHLVTAFRRHEDCAPGEYRRRFKNS